MFREILDLLLDTLGDLQMVVVLFVEQLIQIIKRDRK
jgi:hypothetical protein